MSTDEVIKFILSNEFTSSLSVTTVIAILSFTALHFRKAIHAQRIVNFLKLSAQEGNYQFRSTEAIASAVKLTEARVEEICSEHKGIRRNSAQKQSWSLAEKE